MWKDYDLNNPSSWTVMEAPPVDPSWEAALTRIGGLNPFGKPILVWRWGATYRDPMALDGGLKYFVGRTEPTCRGYYYRDGEEIIKVPHGQLESIPTNRVALPWYEADDLGERRIIIEQWRSAEFLARSGRYQTESIRDDGKSTDYVFCRGCDSQRSINRDPEEQCSQCGSRRTYIRTERDTGDGKLLKPLQPEGAYDCFLRLENAEGEPMEPDGHALALIEKMWKRQNTQTQREKLSDMVSETAQQDALNREATSPSNPFGTPATLGR